MSILVFQVYGKHNLKACWEWCSCLGTGFAACCSVSIIDQLLIPSTRCLKLAEEGYQNRLNIQNISCFIMFDQRSWTPSGIPQNHVQSWLQLSLSLDGSSFLLNCFHPVLDLILNRIFKIPAPWTQSPVWSTKSVWCFVTKGFELRR